MNRRDKRALISKGKGNQAGRSRVVARNL
jgi:hypothetical protein